MKNNFDELIAKIDKYAGTMLRQSRYDHSMRVAKYASYLANLYKDENVSEEKAFFTGLAHDICKHHSDDVLVEIVNKDGFGIDSIEKKRLNLLHGRAAAVVLEEEFGVSDRSILNAIAFHTFGYEGIDALGKIIYIADKIEPERPNTKEFRDIVQTVSLNELAFKIICWNIDYIKSKGAEIHPFTKKMYLQIRKELNES